MKRTRQKKKDGSRWMVRAVAVGALAMLLASSANAASITTIFQRNNGGANGGAVYFDVTVGASPLEIIGFDTNTNDVVPSFGWSVYTTPGTSVGAQSNPGVWTQVATGTGVGLGQDLASPVTLDNTFILGANTSYGLALVIGPEAGHDYSGSGTNPAPAMLQYSNADLTLDLGSAGNVPFSGSAFSPRIWNGTMYYNIVPEPASLALVALGGLALVRRRF